VNVPEPLDGDQVDALFNDLVAGLEQETPERATLFTLNGDGTVSVHLAPDWRAALAHMVGELIEVLGDDGLSAIPLYPVAHPGDVAAQADFIDRTHNALKDARIDTARMFLELIWLERFDVGHVDVWLRTMNAMRLLLARDVESDDDLASFYASAEPGAAAFMLTSAVLDELLSAIG